MKSTLALVSLLEFLVPFDCQQFRSWMHMGRLMDVRSVKRESKQHGLVVATAGPQPRQQTCWAGSASCGSRNLRNIPDPVHALLGRQIAEEKPEPLRARAGGCKVQRRVQILRMQHRKPAPGRVLHRLVRGSLHLLLHV